MSEHDGLPLPAAGRRKTSLGRFGAAFALAAFAAVCLPFVVTPTLITATGSREQGMAVGVPLGMLTGFFIFPFVAWRPFRAFQLLALPVVAVAVLAGLTVLPEHWLTSPEGDRNGIFGVMFNAALCFLAVYGALTWSRNVLLHASADLPREELSPLDRTAVEFVKTVRPRLARLWRPRSKGRPDSDAT